MNHENLMDALKAAGADTDGILERFLGDKELYAGCLKEFLQDESFAALYKALEHRDYLKAVEHAHALKGVAGNLGLLPLYAAIDEIVKALRLKNYDVLGGLYAAAAHERGTLCSLLR